MKERAFVGFILLVYLAGCIANNTLADADAADNNVNRLSRIVLRMNEDEVLQILHAPYSKETYRVGEDRYDVWFYVTTITALGQSRMVPKNLTPLTFRNRQLVGVGYDYYHWIMKRDEVKKPSRPVEAPESEGLERALEKTSSPASTPVPPQPKMPPPQPNQPPPSKTPPNPTQPPSSPKPNAPPNEPPKTPPTPAQPTTPPKPNTPPNKEPPPPNQSPYQPPPPSGPKPPPPKSQKLPQQSTMSQPPAKTDVEEKDAQKKNSDQKPDQKPDWNKKDEEINQDAMDQDFNYW